MSGSGVVKITANTLAGIGLFQGLPESERSAIASHCQGRRFAADQQILSHDDPARDVYFIISGVVRITYFSRSGKEVSFRDEGAGEMFGEIAAIDGRPRSAQVFALADSVLASISRDTFRELLLHNEQVQDRVLQRLTDLVRLLSERVVEFSALSVKNRIHAELLRLANTGTLSGGAASIAPVPKHADIANRVSTRREAVTRELNELEHSGLIERQTDVWIIKDMERLHALVHDLLG